MSTPSEAHLTLTDGVGKCSCPMWQMGMPAGFCDEPAYSKYVDGPKWRDAYTGEQRRWDGKYTGYVPELACPHHGGLTKEEAGAKSKDIEGQKP